MGALCCLPACSGTPIGLPVDDEPSEAILTDFRTGPLQEAAAFSLLSLSSVRTDQTGQWDFLFGIAEDGSTQLFPRASVVDQSSSAGLQVVNESFDGLTVAPAAGYVTDEPVPVEVGDVLAAVSQRNCQQLALRRFGKLEILDIDLETGMLLFKFLTNPNCELRTLIPGQVGEI